MGELANWNLKVSRELDIDLRAFLAERGGQDGDLSRFVEDVVNRELLRQTVQEIRAQNQHQDPEEIERIIDEELAEVRKVLWPKKA